jgi:predicted transcriptional regulator of viral defense system/very-short-patch-repair endonuclease
MDVLEQTRAFDKRIAELAERQHGVVARRQLLVLGLGREAIEVRLRAGRLHPLHRGVYSVGHEVVSQEGRWIATVLFAGSGAVLSHRSAAALWGIRGTSSGAIEVTTPRKSRSRGGLRRHFATLPADEVTIERGIPVTTVPRTIFDLAANSSVDAVEHGLRESEYLRLHDRLSLLHLLDRYPRRRGARAVQECLARRAEGPSGRVRSRLEERFLPFLRQHRLPMPWLNAWIPLEPKGCEVDCLWRAQRQIVELDGYEGHGTRGAFREDRARDRRLRVAGYGVTRIAWGQLHDEPDEIATDLRALLGTPDAKYKRP